eukprot:4690071-Alexandrium_andersonii.AAC.1
MSLSSAFLQVLASFRFIPIMEDCIEGAHAVVSKQGAKGTLTLGPVRVSLANRLPLIRDRIRGDARFLERLGEQFERARRIQAIP